MRLSGHAFSNIGILRHCFASDERPCQVTLHQYRGAPMTARTISQLIVDLDILASYSMPRVSDDNPCSESQFNTLKRAPS